MNHPTRTQFASLAILTTLVSAAFGGYYFNTSSIVNDQGQSISSLQSRVSSLQHSTPSSTTITSTTTSVVTSTSTKSVTLEQTMTVTQFAGLPSAYSIESANVSLNYWPGNMAVNPRTHAAYVAGAFSNDFTEINSTDGRIVWRVSLPSTEQGRMAVDSSANVVFVPVAGCTNTAGASNECGKVTRPVPGVVEIDGSTGNRIRMLNFSVYQTVAQLGVDERTGVLLVATNRFTSSPPNMTGSFLVIDPETGSVMRNISLKGGPRDGVIEGLAINPRTRMAYLPLCGWAGLICLGSIVGINITSFRTISITIPGAEFWSVGVNPSTNILYATSPQYYLNSTHAVLVAIDATTNQVLRITRLGTFFSHAYFLQVNPEQNEIYVLSLDANGVLWIVDGTNGSILSAYTVAGTPQALEFDPNLQRLYVAVNPTGSAPYGSIHILMVKQLVLV